MATKPWLNKGRKQLFQRPIDRGFLAVRFRDQNLTNGLRRVITGATMLERLGFHQLIEKTLTVQTAHAGHEQFVLAMVLAAYVGLRIVTLDNRHDRAHAVWPADGEGGATTRRTKGRKLPADAYSSG